MADATITLDLSLKDAEANLKQFSTDIDAAAHKMDQQSAAAGKSFAANAAAGAHGAEQAHRSASQRIKEMWETTFDRIKEKGKSLKESAPEVGGGIGGMMGGAGAMLGPLAGGAAAAEIGMKFVEAGKKNLEIQEGLKKAFMATGMSSDQADAALKKQLDTTKQLADQYALNENSVNNATAAYLQFGGSADNLKEKQEIIIGLAERLKAKGMDEASAMQQAAVMTAKTGGEEAIGGLQKLGIQLDKNATQAERLKAMHDEATKGLKGLSDAAGSPLGMFEKFKNTLEQFMQKAGTPLFKILVAILQPLGELAGTLMDALSPILDAIGAILGFILPPLGKLLYWFVIITNPILLTIKGFQLLYEKVQFFRDAVDKVVSIGSSVIGFFKNLVGAKDDETSAEEKNTKAIQDNTEAMQMNADQAKQLADDSVKAINDFAVKTEAIALQNGKTLKEAEVEALKVKIQGYKNTTDALRRAGEENYQMELDLAKLEKELHEKEKKKDHDGTLAEIDKFIADQKAKDMDARAKEFAQLDNTYKEKRDKLKKALDEKHIIQAQFDAENLKLDAQAHADRKALNDKFDAEDLKKTQEENDKKFALQKQLDDKLLSLQQEAAKKHRDLRIASIQDEGQRALAEEDAKYADEQAANRKQLGDETDALLEQLHKNLISKEDYKQRELQLGAIFNAAQQDAATAHEQRLYDISLQGLLQRNNIISTFAKTAQGTENQLYSWMDERVKSGAQNQKTIWFGMQNDLLSGAKSFITKRISMIGEGLATELGLTAASEAQKTMLEKQSGLAALGGAAMWIGAQLSKAAASMVSAVAALISWNVTTFGPFAIATIPAELAAVYGMFKGAKSMLGFAEGGLMGTLVGEKGVEVIAPHKDFSDFAVNLTTQIAAATDRALRSTSGGARANDELLREMKQLNTNLIRTKTQLGVTIHQDGQMKLSGNDAVMMVQRSSSHIAAVTG